jgi:hypothetical protein
MAQRSGHDTQVFINSWAIAGGRADHPSPADSERRRDPADQRANVDNKLARSSRVPHSRRLS